MSNVYTPPTLTGYNSSPPADDGTQVASNQVEWAKHINKIGNPLSTYAASISSAVLAGFAKTFMLGGVKSVATTYTLLAGDQGKVLYCSNTFTLTLLAAATAGSQYTVMIVNSGSGVVTIDGSGAETIVTGGGADGATAVLNPGEAIVITSNGTSTWYGLKTFGNVLLSSPANGEVLTYNSSTGLWENQAISGIGDFVTDANYPIISGTSSFDIDANITESTWETVGPTGSGADNIWTALDNVPANADWICLRFNIFGSSSGDTANTGYQGAVYCGVARSGAPASADTVARIAYTTGSTGNGTATIVTEATIPIDSNNAFSMYWAFAGNVAPAYLAYLVGWGFN